MNLIYSIDFFYEKDCLNQLIIASRRCFYGAEGTAEDLLGVLCEANGRSMHGSMELFAKVNNAHQKLAVLVDPFSQEIYFPTHASSNRECFWINYGKVRHVKSVDQGTQVEFQSGALLSVNCSKRVILRQMQRCDKLLKSLGNPYEKINALVHVI